MTQNDLDKGRVYPPLSDILTVSTQIAADVVEFAYRNNMAHRFPEPKNKVEFIKSVQYDSDYENFIPNIYDWPVNGKL